MKKLIRGIIDFQHNVLPKRREIFAKLALGQSPDTLFIACSDSRVAPNWFASTDPGDLFVIRNVGNLVAPSGRNGHSAADESEGAAIEFAIANLGVKDIIICGHSECGAMQALINGREKVQTPNLKAWLRHGEIALSKLNDMSDFAPNLPRHNRLSQLNVVQQIENIKSYPIVKEKLAIGEIRIHGWWFELSNAAVHIYDTGKKKFVRIDDKEANHLLQGMDE